MYTSNQNGSHPSYLHVCGKSSANQRIERFWGRLRTAFTDVWKKKSFKDLCDTGCLDTSNNLHIQCVRYVFLPLIQTQLDTFRHMWNLHWVRFQSQVSTPLGIPNVLFYQPYLYDVHDYSIPLSFDIEALDELTTEYTLCYPEFGCSDDFSKLVEALTNTNRYELEMPKAMQEGLELYVCLSELIAAIDNAL